MITFDLVSDLERSISRCVKVSLRQFCAFQNFDSIIRVILAT